MQMLHMLNFEQENEKDYGSKTLKTSRKFKQNQIKMINYRIIFLYLLYRFPMGYVKTSKNF